MFKLLEHGDLFIIFKGGSGTMSEFGTSWVLAKLYYGHHKPFILFGEFWIEIIDALKKNMNLDQQELSVFEICTKVEDVLPTIERFEKNVEKRDHNHDGDGIDKAFMD
jgi:predicted Rossmann-fold nucleotide-binding protein